jgi:tRNA-Thr(GGU) m(6)t(6)A37 methyltransferase TsaA
MSSPLALQAIGVIRTARTHWEKTPVQSSLNPDEPGQLHVYEPFVPGLAGIEDFDNLWLLCWLGDGNWSPTEPPPMTQVPFLLQREQRSVGIFATRGPRRVNPIGLSLVRLDTVEGGVITFRGVDMVDGTLVIDIKPYVTRFDRPGDEPRCGWFDGVDLPAAATPDDLAH